MKPKGTNRIRFTDKMVLIGTGLGALFWILESVIHVYVFRTGNFVSEIFSRDPNELWMRFLVVFILIAFGMYAQVVIRQRERAQRAMRESEVWLSATLDSIGDAVMATDTNGCVAFMNPVAHSLTSWDQEKAIGKPLEHVFNIINEETRKPVENPVTKVIRDGMVVGLANHTILIAKDGKEIAIDDSGAPIRNEEGDIIGVILVFRDVSDRRRAEQALLQSEERYRRITEAVTDYIFTVRIEDGHPVETVHSPACFAVTGYTPEDFASDPHLWFRIVHEEDREAVQERTRQVLSKQDVKPLEHRIFRKGGLMRWVRNTLVPNYDSHGKLLSYNGLISDIDERKRTEETLRESEELFRNVYGTAPLAFVVWDVDTRVTDWNKKAEEVFGWSKEEAFHRNFLDFLIPEKDRPHVERLVDRLIKSDLPSHSINDNLTKHGQTITCEWNNSPLHDDDGNIVGAMSLALDITERKKAEKELRESEDRYRRITEAITDYIYTVTVEDGRPVQTIHGPACVAVTGYTAEHFKENPYLWIQMVHEEDRAAVEELAARTLSGERVPAPEHRIIRKDGATRWVRNTPVLNFDSQGRLLSYDGLVQDVTERKQAQEALRKAHDALERFNLELEQKVQERTEELRQKNEQLVQAERLAAIGKITNRVAHELRNPLTAVGGFARRINKRAPADDPNKKYLQMIVDEVMTMESKLSEITRIQSQ